MSRPNDTAAGIEPEKVFFGDFVLDLERAELAHEGRPVRLRPQATRALLLLVDRAGHLVSRAELRRALWGETAVDWDQGTNQVIRQIRQALGDDARHPRFLETVPRRGYRFCAAITPLQTTRRHPPPGRPSMWPVRMGYFGAGVATSLAIPAIVIVVCALLAT